MLDFPKWKIWIVVATILTGLFLAIPSLMPVKTRDEMLPSWWSAAHINLGLDLSGGSQLLLEADTTDVRKAKLEKMEVEVERTMKRAEPSAIEIGEIARTDGALQFMVRNQNQLDKAVDLLTNLTNGVGVTGQRDWSITTKDGNTIVMSPTDAGLEFAVNQAMDDAREKIETRANPDGTKEPTVIRQGASRILVQVPGESDPEGLKRRIGQTARLEFREVIFDANPEDIKAGRAPIGGEILPRIDGGVAVLKRRPVVTGDELTDAQQGYDPENPATAVVNITFDQSGGKKFGRFTQDNVGKPFAIVLDGKVLSDPVIRGAILGGSSQISGGFTTESAQDLATALRSGKLPVTLKVVEETTVSPELGRDSIESGIKAGILATIALVIYMVATYFRFGVYTTLALFLNGLLVLGGMAIFNATLTLPGIAGFVLTIGAAVDANVLINERIREEIRRGRKTIQSVEFGYKEASTAIFDANITNVISALILFWFGSGPIKGFAVVLAIGIATSVFTGVTFTRLLVKGYLERSRPQSLVL
jgi:preprotein translocase subunit SecD